MVPDLFSVARKGAVAVGLVAGLSAPAFSAPSGLGIMPGLSDGNTPNSLLIQVRDGGGGHGGGGGHFGGRGGMGGDIWMRGGHGGMMGRGYGGYGRNTPIYRGMAGGFSGYGRGYHGRGGPYYRGAAGSYGRGYYGGGPYYRGVANGYGRGYNGRGYYGRGYYNRAYYGGRYYNRHGRYYGNYPGYYYDNGYYDNASIYLDLGVPLYGLFGGYYGGYGNAYYDSFSYSDYGPQVYQTTGLSSDHVRWCFNRYRSYRAADNSFQPYDGPRRQCISPYR